MVMGIFKGAKTWRTLATLATAATLGAACGSAPPARHEGGQAMPKLAVQLYSVKDELRKDFDGTLARLAALGIDGVEFAGQFGGYRVKPAELRALLERHRLACAGAHTPLPSLSGRNFGTTTTFYRALGCSNLIVPSDPRAVTVAGAAEVAEEVSSLSVKLAAIGMRIGYHNHAEEMLGADGQEPWIVIGERTPSSVIMQQDVGWTAVARKDPIAMVKRLPGRTVTTHYKVKFAPGDSGTPIIGQDGADWAGLTQANRQVGGTQWIIIEQEEYPNDMGQVDTVAASLAGLRRCLAMLPR